MRVPPKLSGFVCAFNPAVLGSSPKHTINAIVNILNCAVWKKSKINKKEAGIGPFFKKYVSEYSLIQPDHGKVNFLFGNTRMCVK